VIVDQRLLNIRNIRKPGTGSNTNLHMVNWMQYSYAVMRLRTPFAGLTPTGAWVCLLLLGWALAGSWFGHTHVPHCESCVCDAHDEDGGGIALFAAKVEEREVCLACHLLRCLQTAFPSANAKISVLTAQEAPPSGAVLVASVPAAINSAARSPPLV
jgi:hypothetical protein